MPFSYEQCVADARAQEQARNADYLGRLDRGGWDAFFQGLQGTPVDNLTGQQWLPISGATNYQATPEQVGALTQTVPMRMAETNRLLYKGRLYESPIDITSLQTGLSPQVKQNVSQAETSGGVGNWWTQMGQPYSRRHHQLGCGPGGATRDAGAFLPAFGRRGVAASCWGRHTASGGGRHLPCASGLGQEPLAVFGLVGAALALAWGEAR